MDLELSERIRRYLDDPEHRARFHIWIDDGNDRNMYLSSIKQNCVEAGDTEGAEIIQSLLDSSRTQRKKQASQWWDSQCSA